MKSRDEEPARTPRASRRRTPPPQPTCVLSIGSQRLPAVIAEERGGTMHVMVQGSPQFWVEDSGSLTTPEGELSIRVFNIVRVEAPEGDPAGSIPAFRIGLERLGMVARETEPDEDVEDEEEDEVQKLTRRKRFSLGGPLAMIAALAVLIFAAGNWQRIVGFRLGGMVQARPYPDSTAQNVTTPDAIATVAPETGGNAGSTQALQGSLKLPGVEALLQPEVAAKLQLTPAQTDACQRLDATTKGAIEELEKYWGSGDRWELARKRSVLLDAARDEALELLTEPQRKLWDEMSR